MCLTSENYIVPTSRTSAVRRFKPSPEVFLDWNYTSLSLKYASNQTIAMTRGRVLGYTLIKSSQLTPPVLAAHLR
jgi:hypothetical protein